MEATKIIIKGSVNGFSQVCVEEMMLSCGKIGVIVVIRLSGRAFYGIGMLEQSQCLKGLETKCVGEF